MPDAETVSDHAVADGVFARDAVLLTGVVREAGALALSLFRTELRNWIKGKSSPVSEADIAVNDLLERRLRDATPDYGWLSEESVDDPARLGKRRVWIVDPIDGTRSYLAGLEDWCVSVGLVEDGIPVLGAVFVPTSDEFFFATRGAGATRNGSIIHTAPGAKLDPARIVGPKPLVERLGDALEPGKIHPRIGSLALKICRAAEGRLDVAFAGGHSRDWDLAAADLIVHEAGGLMTALTGDVIVYNRPEVKHETLVAAGQARHARVVEHFRQHPLF
ncbi:3'(2'),5'-bisphosphate nucleotidase CysQ [Bradyrhizobium prioriisuperbiae]|uniref:3'(2'),5'-bisphosphate nucleotidase CysQ n=1 Tax=Bradyrhizobium prioriisuperbiae TaxID=2854389 RepID=UPI0028E187E1|nr:3'(2'),5'-bisphosphate nucleotidase CysQ [Bradyrhizobium prioritasuperba]